MASLVRQIVDLHRRQIAGVVEIRGVGRLKKLYAEGRGELEQKLRRLARAGRGQTFEAQHLRAILVQVADVSRSFEIDLQDHLQDTGRIAGNLAPKHLVNMVGQLEQKFGRITPVVQAAQAAVVRGAYPGIAPTLIDHYKRSARLYGPQTVTAIRHGLASQLIQGETVDQAVARVADAGGLFDQQLWRAERIVRTEASYSYGVVNQRAMMELRPAVPAMMKRLVATFDDRTGEDSEELNGQTVPVDQPFIWITPKGKTVRYMQPPNRPNDREVVIPWVQGWSTAGLTAPGPVEPEMPA